ncbi:DUF3050 domain-containing protein [Spirosoma sp. HMF3257]|uniref:Heme oxygenase n=1 Tax=Spirosoma telluris TaxID=2183553 RepID=A0A327NSV0_9BACT|nr:DUF3050 domain-containing protein [Spirosoma telluris]RAI78322.1 heme oxygenase [Spirosoma telluris]
MNARIEQIQQSIELLRQEIINHKVYDAIQSVEDVRVFMQYHVFAVWDFMSLLKALQLKLTCTSVPWFPKGSAETRYLINEIVAGEESDVDQDGTRKSHFELYLDAMQQCGADTLPIETFIATLKETGDFNQAFTASATPKAATNFVDFTFDVISSDQEHLQSAVFTFGREDLIPGMFISIINDLHKKFPDSLSIFKYYLERHIEVDGDHHSQLALQMTATLCGDNEQYWLEAEQVIQQALQKRIDLWDGVYNELTNRKADGQLVAEMASLV